MKETFAGKVRSVMSSKTQAGQQEITVQEIARVLDLVSDADKKPLYSALSDFVKSGEVKLVSPGIYAYLGRNKHPDIRSAMWSILRMRKVVTVNDLQEMAGASKEYAEEFVNMLRRRGVVEKMTRKGACAVYRMTDDIGPQTPEDTAKIERLRSISAAKKAALELIEDAWHDLISASQKLISARIAINDIKEE
jgi:predicted transcriptional regulator of viral defense system